MSHNSRQSSLKALLHNYQKCYETHNMVMRYESLNIMYIDTEDMPAPHDPASLEQTTPTKSIPEEEGEATAKYS